MKLIKHIISITLILTFTLSSTAKVKSPSYINIPEQAYAWSDSVYKSMTLQERIGQLFVAGALPPKMPTIWLTLQKW